MQRRHTRLRTLDRLLSKAGLGSRTQAREWILAGRVAVNGRCVRTPERWVDPTRDRITLDGRPVEPQPKIYIALHKPVGYLTTRRDPSGRPTVYDLLSGLEVWVSPVGRLDLDSSGLLLLTNDTEFADRITDPAGKVPKVYRLQTVPPLSEAQLEMLVRGVELSDGPARAVRARPICQAAEFEITLTEGRNRQLRRMVRAVGARVKRLVRVAIGPLTLEGLPPGARRRLSAAEVRALVRAAQRGR